MCAWWTRKTRWYATKVASEPEALVRFLGREDLKIARVGLKAGPLSQWLHDGLVTGGYEAVPCGAKG